MQKLVDLGLMLLFVISSFASLESHQLGDQLSLRVLPRDDVHSG